MLFARLCGLRGQSLLIDESWKKLIAFVLQNYLGADVYVTSIVLLINNH